MHNPGGYIDWLSEDWEIDDDNMWSSRSLFDIFMSRSIILLNKKIK